MECEGEIFRRNNFVLEIRLASNFRLPPDFRLVCQVVKARTKSSRGQSSTVGCFCGFFGVLKRILAASGHRVVVELLASYSPKFGSLRVPIVSKEPSR
jgi:hypothetical protein